MAHTSGWLGITLLEGLEAQWEHPYPGTFPKETMMEFIERLGHIVEYDSKFHIKNVTVDHFHEGPGKKGAYRVAHMSFCDKVSFGADSGRPIF
jgi:hypothetical protein